MAVNNGISVSFNNTPQAKDDFFSAAWDGLTEDNLASRTPLVLDVMANDAGGNAKSLYSVDDGINSAGATGDLLQHDIVGGANLSLHGATIKITADGKISYDASTLDASFVAGLQHLAAGEFATDTFTYAIQLGNGTLSWATATVQIAGVNDAPVVAGPVTGNAIEDGPAVTLNALANATDVDHGAVLSVTDVPSQLPAGVSYNAATHSFTLDPSNGAYQHLAQGQQTTVTVTYDVTDGIAITPASASWLVTGTNDAPVVSGAVSGNATEDGLAVALNALANASDVDDGTVLQVTIVPASLPAGVTYNAAAHSFTLDPSDAAFQHLALNQQTTVSVNYGVSDGLSTTPASASWTVTGSNDAPTLQTPVAAAPVLANDSLTVTDTLAFADLDLIDTHAVTFTPQGSNYIGDFLSVITADANGHGSITATYHLTKAQVDANDGHFPDHQDYLVTIDDHHGGFSSQVVSIPLAQILSGIGGDGGNGGPNHVPVITYSTADDMAGGRPLTAFVWDDPTVSSLHTSGFLDFQDPDAHDAHHVQVFAAPTNWGHLGTPLLLDAPSSGGHGQIQWQYSVDESVVRPLAGGEAHNSDQFLFRLFDSTGAFVDHAVNIPIFGLDEAPVVQGPSNITVDASADGPIDLSGTFFFSDADLSDTHHLETYPTPDGFGGFFTATLVHDTVNGIGGEVHWTYDLDPSGLQYLAEGESISETLPVIIYGNNDALRALGAPVDNHGMSTSENITFVINGVNDDPYFRTPPVTITESPFLASDSGVHRSDNIGFGDFDNNDMHFAFASFNSSASSGAEVGHFVASVQDDTTGGTNVNGVIHWQYEAATADFGNNNTPIHQVYDIVLQDYHGGQTIQPFIVDLLPHF